MNEIMSERKEDGIPNDRSIPGYVFPKTIPVMVGYLFLGTAYGVLMSVNGYGVGWAVATSVIVYAGSLQYVGINLLSSAVSPAAAFLMALMVNARHLFLRNFHAGKIPQYGKGEALSDIWSYR